MNQGSTLHTSSNRTVHRAIGATSWRGVVLALLNLASIANAEITPQATQRETMAQDQHNAQSDRDAPAKVAPAIPGFEYALGMGVAQKPDYLGASGSHFDLRPVWWLRYGRFTIIGPRGGLSRNPDRVSESQGGASATVLETEQLRFNLGLRVENGRSASESPRLAGIPDIKRRVVYIAGVAYDFAPDWAITAKLSGDVTGAKTGTTATITIGTHGHFDPKTYWNLSASAAYADRYGMHARFGVPSGAGLPAYAPDASPLDAGIEINIRRQIFDHWSIFGSAGHARLLGDARNSPLTLKRDQRNFFVGFAYQSAPSR